MPSLLISRIYELSKSGPATSTSTTISFEPGKITLLYIRYLKLEDSSSYLMILYLSSGQERSDRGEEVSTIAMTGKQTGKTRKETPLFRGNMRKLLYLFTLKGMGDCISCLISD